MAFLGDFLKQLVPLLSERIVDLGRCGLLLIGQLQLVLNRVEREQPRKRNLTGPKTATTAALRVRTRCEHKQEESAQQCESNRIRSKSHHAVCLSMNNRARIRAS